MPERHTPEHQEDDRGHDDDVEDEVEEEGIHENEGWRAGGLEAVQRCKSEQSSCANV
jgi:hypothetical protein